MPSFNVKPPDDQTILRTLSTARYRNIQDQRGAPRGALWVITDRAERKDSEFFWRLNRQGYNFRYAKNGSKATDGRPAWWWQPEDPEQARKRWQTIVKKHLRNRHRAQHIIEFYEQRDGKLSQEQIALMLSDLTNSPEDANAIISSVLLELKQRRSKRKKT